MRNVYSYANGFEFNYMIADEWNNKMQRFC